MTVYLNPDQVPAAWKGDYKGKKYQARIVESLTIADYQMQWSGGTRSIFTAFGVDGKSIAVKPVKQWPDFGEQTIRLQPGMVIVEHVIFCGNDMGCVIYAHPADVNPALAAPKVELTENEKWVLYATRAFKASYAGRNRRQMLNDELAYKGKEMSEQAWLAASEALKAKKLLNARGAITVEGKNAIGNYRV